MEASSPRLRRSFSASPSLGIALSFFAHAVTLVALWVWGMGSSSGPEPQFASARDPAPMQIRWEPSARPRSSGAEPTPAPRLLAPLDRSTDALLRPPERPPLAEGAPGAVVEAVPASAEPPPWVERVALPDSPPPPPRPPASSVISRAGPVLLDRVEPVYPRSCLAARHEGVVELLLAVDASGRVTAARVIGKSPCRELDEAARRAALRLRYTPALENGRPVPTETRLRVRFVLERE